MIAVFGATGQIGRHVAASLAQLGVEARALVRDPVAEVPLPTVYADLDHPETLPRAIAGADRLLLLTSHGDGQERRERAAIDAAVAEGVDFIVKVSGSAASLGPNGPAATAVAHWRSEQHIERAGLPFAFLRPSFFMQNLLDTVAPMVASTRILAAPFGAAPIAMVDVRDVAASAVAALLAADGAGAGIWQLTGPGPATFPRIAAHLDARHLRVPAGLAARLLSRRGLTAVEVDHASRMAAYFAAGCDGVATDHVLRLTGRPPRSVEAFLDEHRSAFQGTRSVKQFTARTTHH